MTQSLFTRLCFIQSSLEMKKWEWGEEDEVYDPCLTHCSAGRFVVIKQRTEEQEQMCFRLRQLNDAQDCGQCWASQFNPTFRNCVKSLCCNLWMIILIAQSLICLRVKRPHQQLKAVWTLLLFNAVSNPWSRLYLQERIVELFLEFALCFLVQKSVPMPKSWSHLKPSCTKGNVLEIAAFACSQLTGSVLHQAQPYCGYQQAGSKFHCLSCSISFSNRFWHIFLKAFWLTKLSLPVLHYIT